MGVINEKSVWYKKKRTWFLVILLAGLGLFISVLPSELPMNIAYLAKAYSEPEICKEALKITKKNPKVLEILGELEPMGGLDMLNGSVFYSKGGDSVAITINIRGDREIKDIRSKMDVVAHKIGENWEYHKIRVRIKRPPELKQRILILE